MLRQYSEKRIPPTVICCFSVCETVYEEVEVKEDTPVCKDQEEEMCFASDNGGNGICTMVKKKVCSLEKVTKTEMVPSTSCKLVEKPRAVCGPQICPVTKSKPVCEDKIKMVTFISFISF